MRIEELQKYKKILILGFGKEGKSALQFITHFHPDAEAGIADQTQGENYLKRQFDFDLVIKTPGIPKRLVTAPYTTAVNLFFGNAKGKIIGVTGSKGKSTTASLIHEILKEAGMKSHLVGNIGNPALNELLHKNSAEDIWVYELSSYNLDDIKYSPHISVFLNFFPDHMDYHGGVEEYWLAKKRIFAKAGKSDFFIYDSGSARIGELVKETRARAIAFEENLPLPESDIPLLGNHNLENVRAAVSAARLIKIPEEKIARAIKNFKSLPHRLEKVGTYKGITFYNDALATTPEATIAGIKSLGRIGTLIAGGQDRGYNFQELAQLIRERQIPNLVLFPASGAKIQSSIRQQLGRRARNPPQFHYAADMEEAVRLAYASTPKNSICLLSCASPSYTLWKNFEEKGDLFKKFVRKMGE